MLSVQVTRPTVQRLFAKNTERTEHKLPSHWAFDCWWKPSNKEENVSNIKIIRSWQLVTHDCALLDHCTTMDYPRVDVAPTGFSQWFMTVLYLSDVLDFLLMLYLLLRIQPISMQWRPVLAMQASSLLWRSGIGCYSIPTSGTPRTLKLMCK